MATAKTKAQTDEVPAENPNADVHHMIRSVGSANTADGIISPDVADEHVRTWLRAGFKLSHVETLDSGTVDAVYRAVLLYIFVK